MYAADNAKTAARAPLTVPKLRQMKAESQRIAALTAYDASFARVLDAAGVDVVLVGDSLGMVIQGHSSTLPVTVDDIVYHTACVARGLRSALLIADMPFQSYATNDRSIDAASAPEQTKYWRLPTAVTSSEPAAQFKVKAVAPTPVEAEKVPAVGSVVSAVVDCAMPS